MQERKLEHPNVGSRREDDVEHQKYHQTGSSRHEPQRCRDASDFGMVAEAALINKTQRQQSQDRSDRRKYGVNRQENLIRRLKFRSPVERSAAHEEGLRSVSNEEQCC